MKTSSEEEVLEDPQPMLSTEAAYGAGGVLLLQLAV